MKLNISDKFLRYGERIGDFKDGNCIINIQELDSIVLTALLDSYFTKGYQMALSDKKAMEYEQKQIELFEKQQQKLFDD